MRTLLFGLLLSIIPSAGAASTLAEAQAAYGVYDVNKAETLYREVASDPAAPAKDRAAANRELARIAWLVDGQRDGALAILAASLREDPDPCPAAHLYARIRNAGPLPEPAPVLARLETQCLGTEPGVALEGIRSLQLAALELAGEGPQRSAAVAALRQLNALPEPVRFSAQGAKLRLALGILAADAHVALAGWRDYFWLDDRTHAPEAIAADVPRVFREGLAPQPATGAALRLAGLLMRSGFHEDLRAYAERRQLARVEGWEPIGVYLDLHDALTSEILAHDRRYARKGPADEDAYEKKLTAILASAAEQLAQGVGWQDALYREFGLWGTEPGKSNGVSGVHLGHVVVDERQKVTQDNRSGEIRFIVLDNMIHNSFSAWLMDGASAPGGWAVDGATIVQVRPRYLTLIDGFARIARPGAARENAYAEAEAERLSDRRIAASTPIAFLSGVRSRLRLAGIDALADEVRATLSSEDNFEMAFKKAYYDALVESAITAHEGRHVLDQATFAGPCELENAELEYRAKLSELRFARNARLALSSIYSPLFGGTSGHGVANERLMREIAEWIAARPEEIKNYDASLTPLEQLDKLTDEQIGDIASSLEEPAMRPC
ncbi:hypothetical protein [Pelagerythrobacter rhizovicinus]|uniref:Tetratricopeptide repeat protein n=1 Tax=Pelagerythrobacter rhizovicinus TaxID=2268576 RepID=A0A4Q2KLK8_9SPHN|nr:hypothetical protein [Pelagerythrobacter rhizovicinus]RXZ64233.1 hypothetical protein ETX26_09985 [Pelagerythrobacter rhizovicinus]